MCQFARHLLGLQYSQGANSSYLSSEPVSFSKSDQVRNQSTLSLATLTTWGTEFGVSCIFWITEHGQTPKFLVHIVYLLHHTLKWKHREGCLVVTKCGSLTFEQLTCPVAYQQCAGGMHTPCTPQPNKAWWPHRRFVFQCQSTHSATLWHLKINFWIEL